jgi:anti-sigma B factor antagonist
MQEKAPLTVTRKSMNRVDLIATSGRIDASTAPIFDQTLKACLADGRYRLVVDFKGTDYISSAGLKVLVGNLKEVKRHRGDLRLANCSRNLKETLALVGLVPELFKVYDDLLDAVGSY